MNRFSTIFQIFARIVLVKQRLNLLFNNSTDTTFSYHTKCRNKHKITLQNCSTLFREVRVFVYSKFYCAMQHSRNNETTAIGSSCGGFLGPRHQHAGHTQCLRSKSDLRSSRCGLLSAVQGTFITLFIIDGHAICTRQLPRRSGQHDYHHHHHHKPVRFAHIQLA